jgi:putative hydrolase of the HAD superfamily
MVRGAIFDLGSTLIYNHYDNDWPRLRPRMIADLAADLRAQGLAIDPGAFAAAYARNLADFDAQRQTHFKEITTEYVLRKTLDDLGLSLNGLNAARAVAAYYAYSESQWTAMPHVHETLQELQRRGLRLALISNAADDANVQRLIDNQNLRGYFDPIIVSAAAGIRKPNPKIFQPVIEGWGLPPSEIVMIGDTLGADVLGAKNAGLKSVWVTMQADTPSNIAHRHTIVPDAVAASLAELPAILDSL